MTQLVHITGGEVPNDGSYVEVAMCVPYEETASHECNLLVFETFDGYKQIGIYHYFNTSAEMPNIDRSQTLK